MPLTPFFLLPRFLNLLKSRIDNRFFEGSPWRVIGITVAFEWFWKKGWIIMWGKPYFLWCHFWFPRGKKKKKKIGSGAVIVLHRHSPKKKNDSTIISYVRLISIYLTGVGGGGSSDGSGSDEWVRLFVEGGCGWEGEGRRGPKKTCNMVLWDFFFLLKKKICLSHLDVTWLLTVHPYLLSSCYSLCMHQIQSFLSYQKSLFQIKKDDNIYHFHTN